MHEYMVTFTDLNYRNMRRMVVHAYSMIQAAESATATVGEVSVITSIYLAV